MCVVVDVFDNVGDGSSNSSLNTSCQELRFLDNCSQTTPTLDANYITRFQGHVVSVVVETYPTLPLKHFMK